MSSAQTSDSTTSVANMLHPVDFLTQHDARLDILVTKITSALQSSEKSPEGLATHALKLSTEATTTVAASRDLLSRAFHKAALILLRGGHGKDSETRMHAFDVSLALVDAAIDLLPTKRIDTRLPLSLLEVIFSFHTQAELASRVSTIRRRYEAIRASQSERVADLYIIKSVMSCINRDQSGSNPVLSGRLRLMLAASLPVWHPSGMNRRAQYNISNAPDYENVLKNEDTSDVDVALYKAFWRAQELVGNPSLSESPAVWQEAYVSMDRVLCAFKSLPAAKEIETCIDVSKEKQQSRIPKFLTSPSILRLQLEDIRIRRHILMQYAIFLHHLESVAGYTLSEKDTPAWKSSVEFCKTLFESGGEGVKLRKQVYDVMNLDSHGKFKRFVLSLLHRERRWMHWKKHTGYTHLVGNKGAAPTIFKRRKVRSRVDEDDVAQRDVRNDWDSRQNAWCVPPPSECAAPLLERARAELWSADVLKMELKEDMEDDEVSEDMKRANDSKYVWRTLRMLCEENIACLASVSNQENGSLDLEALVRCGADANAK